MPVPYIGITDFTSPTEVRNMLMIFERFRPTGMQRVLHVGVMMSYKTLHGIESKWSAVFPPKEKLAEIFSCDGVFNCLHYADYLDKSRAEDIREAIEWGGEKLSAVQLDMVWPDPYDIEQALASKRIEVILQIGEKAIQISRNDPDEVCDRLMAYDGFVTRVLLDRSLGQGLGMDALELLPFAHAIQERFPHMGIGVAGGLGPDSMHLAIPFVNEFPEASIDAQARLRLNGNSMEPISWLRASEYIKKALAVFAKRMAVAH